MQKESMIGFGILGLLIVFVGGYMLFHFGYLQASSLPSLNFQIPSFSGGAGWVRTAATALAAIGGIILVAVFIRNRRAVVSLVGQTGSLIIILISGVVVVLSLVYDSYMSFIPSAWAIILCLRYRSYSRQDLLVNDSGWKNHWKMVLPKTSFLVLGMWIILILAGLKDSAQ